MNRLISGLSLVCWLSLLTPGAAQIIVDRVPPPETIEGMAKISSLVARVRVSSVRDVRLDINPGKPQNEYVEYTVDILDVAKADERIASAGAEARILVTGSQRVQERGFRVLRNSEELLVFLHWRPLLGAYELTGGPEGAFHIEESRLTPFGRSGMARSQTDGRVESVLERLRQNTPR